MKLLLFNNKKNLALILKSNCGNIFWPKWITRESFEIQDVGISKLSLDVQFNAFMAEILNVKVAYPKPRFYNNSVLNTTEIDKIM